LLATDAYVISSGLYLTADPHVISSGLSLTADAHLISNGPCLTADAYVIASGLYLTADPHVISTAPSLNAETDVPVILNDLSPTAETDPYLTGETFCRRRLICLIATDAHVISHGLVLTAEIPSRFDFSLNC
jgi:hypothetical protein